MTQLIIPWDSLSADALRGIIEDFVTREGTEYGAAEVSLEAKCEQVLRQLRAGRIQITFDSVKHTCSLVPTDDRPPG